MAKRQQADNDRIAKHVITRFDEGTRYATSFRNRIDLLAPYIEPTRGNSQTGMNTPGQALLSRQYDSEGISAADIAVRQIGSYLHGPGSTWFSIEDENQAINDDDEGREWYEECRDRMLKQISRGGFYAESYESDMDWMGFGTGLIRTENKPALSYEREQFGFRGLRFSHHKAGRFVAYENGLSQVDEDYVEMRMTAKAIIDLWGRDAVTDDVRDAFDNGRADEFRVIHGIYPRRPGEVAYGNKAFAFASCYVLYERKHLLHESGYEEFPDAVPRWTRVGGEPYGRGLGEIALNNMITLNAAKKHDLEAMALTVKPPLLQAHDSVIGKRVFSPWGVTVVKVRPGEPLQNAIAPLNVLGRYEFSQIKEEELRASIREIFYADMLKQLMALEGQSQMRVYVFQQKQNITQKLLGPTYGRWEAEFGIPFISRCFNLMLRAGAFSDPPQIILELGGQPKVRFESPLARAQRMEEVEAIQGALQDLAPVVQVQLDQWKMTGQMPQDWVLDNYDLDKLAQKINENRGVPATLTHGQKELMAIRNSRAEQQKAQDMGQDMAQLAEGMGKAAPMAKVMAEQRQ